MILHHMTATFGRLDKAELELDPGLNILTAPNEGGKSTWAAFLLSMLYGINTAERSSKSNQLPAKIRFKPWSGQDMAGSLELSWRGRRITLERTGSARAPMGQLRAFDTETGQAIDLPERDCGQTLLSVERSVYERSGFIRQQGMALTADHALEARLEALVTTGDEDAAGFTPVKKRLEALRNRRRHNRTGLLPEAERALEKTCRQLDELQSLGRETMALQARRDELEDRLRALQNEADALAARETERKRENLEQLRRDWEKKDAALAEKRQTVAGLPEQEDLQKLAQGAARLSEHLAQLETARSGAVPPAPPACPDAFEQLTADQVRDAADEDCRRLEALGRGPQYAPRMVWVLVCLAALTLAFGIYEIVRGQWTGAALGLALTALGAVLAVLRRLRNRNARENACALLARYGEADADGIRRAAAAYREALLLHQARLDAAASAAQALEADWAALSARRDTLLEKLRSFHPALETLDEAQTALQRDIYLRQFFAAAQREADSALAQYEAAAQAVGRLPETGPAASAAATGDPVSTARALEAVRQELAQVSSRLDQARGRMAASGDPAALAAQQAQLTDEIVRLEQEYAALELALAALDRANGVLQTRFSPQINRLAAQYMARMTGAKYDRVLLAQDMQITAREAGEAVSRPLQALSAGTADQLYLSIRLAITALALPPDVPLVLDDALLSFDDVRLAAALELLEELAQERQILLFTCQSREQAWQASRRAAMQKQKPAQ